MSCKAKSALYFSAFVLSIFTYYIMPNSNQALEQELAHAPMQEQTNPAQQVH